MNILFIMADQLRVDYLSCYGHPVLQTPAMDRVGREGTLFNRSHVQSAVCGPSRACFYTGRYLHTNRSTWNEVPLPITEKTAGHYFEEAGYRAAVIGKTHQYREHPMPPYVRDECTSPDQRHLSRMDSVGFEYVAGAAGCCAVPNHEYIEYLLKKNYLGQGQEVALRTMNPTPESQGKYPNDFRRPAAVTAEDSSPHYLTDRAIDFMLETADKPWFLHLSYFRPHHPNFAPSPYNTMFDEADFDSPLRSEAELSHPLFSTLRHERNRNQGDVDDEQHCRHWRAVYAGLIKEIDDNLLRLFNHMDNHGLMDNTMIVFTSDHGELAGDHGFFEKEMCYWQSYHVPLMIRHPQHSQTSNIDAFVESVDILPTCLEAAGLPIPDAIQGRSLMPWLRGETPADWRTFTVGEWTFAHYDAPRKLGLAEENARAILIRNRDYSYCHFNGLPDMMFDLRKDPNELDNIADDPAYVEIRNQLNEMLLDWQLRTWDPIPKQIPNVIIPDWRV